MEFRACCCLKPRTAALLAGFTDLILGMLGIIGISFFQLGYFDSAEKPEVVTLNGSIPVVTEAFPPSPTTQPPNATSTNEDSSRFFYNWNGVVCLYAFSAIFATLHGLLLLIAAGKKIVFVNRAALITNALMILGCVGGTVALFILGYHWFDLILLPFVVALQLYFLWIVLDYHKYFSYSQPVNVKPRA